MNKNICKKCGYFGKAVRDCGSSDVIDFKKVKVCNLELDNLTDWTGVEMFMVGWACGGAWDSDEEPIVDCPYLLEHLLLKHEKKSSHGRQG